MQADCQETRISSDPKDSLIKYGIVSTYVPSNMMNVQSNSCCNANCNVYANVTGIGCIVATVAETVVIIKQLQILLM